MSVNTSAIPGFTPSPEIGIFLSADWGFPKLQLEAESTYSLLNFALVFSTLYQSRLGEATCEWTGWHPDKI
jgi:hypothetical protein